MRMIDSLVSDIRKKPKHKRTYFEQELLDTYIQAAIIGWIKVIGAMLIFTAIIKYIWS